VAEKRFREDLLYRLNVVQIHLPPLKDRIDDIPLLVNHFIRLYSEKTGKQNLTISPEAMRRIYAHNWPGNVRELENVIERAVILCPGQIIGPRDLPEDVASEEGSLELNATLEAIEKEMIERALKRANYVQSHAADLLGIRKNALQYKLKKYNLI